MLVVRSVIVAFALAVTAAGCTDSRPDGYGAAVEALFVKGCAEPAEGQALPEDVCRCAYERIKDAVPFEEYERLDEQLREDPEDIPDEVVDAFAACSGEQETTTTTSTRPSSTTTTRR